MDGSIFEAILSIYITLNFTFIVCLFARYWYIKKNDPEDFEDNGFLTNLFLDDYTGVAWPTVLLLVLNGMAALVALSALVAYIL